MRQAKDIDILVDIVDLEQAQSIILQSGYTITTPTYALTGFKKTYYLSKRHDIALFNRERSTEVELHFNLNYLGIPFFTFKDIPRKYISDYNIYTPTNTYHLLYLMLHAAIHAFSRIRWLHDIALFIEKTTVDLNEVFTLSKALNTEHIVIQTLILIQTFYINDNPAINALVTTNRSKQATRLAQIAQQFIYSDYELSATNSAFNKMFILYRFYLVLLAIKGQKLNALFGDLVKINKIFPYVTMPKYMSVGYYILYPIMIVKYLICKRF